MTADPLSREPAILRRSATWNAGPQAALLWEALQAERRNAEMWRLKYEAARASLEKRVQAGQEAEQ